jgi:ATP-dependent RNA circularization protein (DNA/RNA ligase family)
MLKSTSLKKYQLWVYDLNQRETNSFLSKKIVYNKCMEYNFSDVDKKPLLDMHIRSQSK